MEKVLRLTIKKKWFDMIASGEKKEEYREFKKYWINRLCTDLSFKKYDFIEFKNGYGKNAPTMLVEFNGLRIGEAKPEWSDNWQGDVFIISLGKIVKNESIAKQP
jgi:hypothetical protein